MRKVLMIGALMVVSSLITLPSGKKEANVKVQANDNAFAVGDDVKHIASPFQMTITAMDNQENITCNYLDNRMIYREKTFKAADLIKLPRIQECLPGSITFQESELKFA